MYLTEEEAKELFCPHCYTGAMLEKRMDSNCSATNCMMWRWSDKIPYENGKKVTKKGYCGLGGKP